MAFAATASTKEPRSHSVGPVKHAYLTYTAVSGDTTGTITVASLKDVFHIILDGGLVYTAAPTYSGNVATIAFSDPTANRFGTIVAIGR